MSLDQSVELDMLGLEAAGEAFVVETLELLELGLELEELGSRLAVTEAIRLAFQQGVYETLLVVKSWEETPTTRAREGEKEA